MNSRRKLLVSAQLMGYIFINNYKDDQVVIHRAVLHFMVYEFPRYKRTWHRPTYMTFIHDIRTWHSYMTWYKFIWQAFNWVCCCWSKCQIDCPNTIKLNVILNFNMLSGYNRYLSPPINFNCLEGWNDACSIQLAMTSVRGIWMGIPVIKIKFLKIENGLPFGAYHNANLCLPKWHHHRSCLLQGIQLITPWISS